MRVNFNFVAEIYLFRSLKNKTTNFNSNDIFVIYFAAAVLTTQQVAATASVVNPGYPPTPAPK